MSAYELVKDKKGVIKLTAYNKDYKQYTKEIYRGEDTDFYKILMNYKNKYPDAWIDSKIYGVGSGYLLHISDFIDACENGAFIDYDGNGDVLDVNYEHIHQTKPSKIKKIDSQAMYVMWYNR